MIGKLHILFTIASLFVIPFVLRVNRKLGIFIVFSIVAFGLVCFFMLPQSVPIWNFLKPMAFFQYPWRFLLVASFFSSLLAGAAIFYVGKSTRRPIPEIATVVAILGILILYAKLFVPQVYTSTQSSDYVSPQALFTASKISDEYMPRDFMKPEVPAQKPFAFVSTQSSYFPISITPLISKTQEKKTILTVSHREKVVFHLAYFPAWTVTVDSKNAIPVATGNGMILTLSKGVHTVDFFYKETFVEMLGDILSLTSTIILILVIIKGQVGELNERKSK